MKKLTRRWKDCCCFCTDSRSVDLNVDVNLKAYYFNKLTCGLCESVQSESWCFPGAAAVVKVKLKLLSSSLSPLTSNLLLLSSSSSNRLFEKREKQGKWLDSAGYLARLLLHSNFYWMKLSFSSRKSFSLPLSQVCYYVIQFENCQKT